MVTVNRRLLPIKAHYFFFFAALGPILPQLNMFGRQLGISPAAMGAVTGALPLFWMLAKPTFGYIVDYFVNQRKLIFMGLIAIMSGSYCGLWFLPETPQNNSIQQHFSLDRYMAYLISLQELTSTLKLNKLSNSYTFHNNLCHWTFKNNSSKNRTSTSNYFSAFLYTQNTDQYVPEVFYYNHSYIVPKCDNYGMDNINTNETNVSVNITMFSEVSIYSVNTSRLCKIRANVSDLSCVVKTGDAVYTTGESDNVDEEFALYQSGIFWGFVVLICTGTVAFNVANCIGDAICFDVLGPESIEKYGVQRAWGTLGYGLTALLGGWLIDAVSTHPTKKDFTPAFIVAAILTVFDLFSCQKLKLPKLSSNDTLSAMLLVLKQPRMMVFILFAIIVGMLDSFMIYYTFWFLEELAATQNVTSSIKLLEGMTTAAQSFGGEILFFFLSGRIITKLGYANTLSLCLFCYSLRLFLLSFITAPWHILPIEVVMQGPTYALCYSCIVGYAAEVAPPGLSATMQGLVAGMDDGLGFTVGSLIGGILYSCVGGALAHRVMAMVAAIAAVAHLALHCFTPLSQSRNNEDEKTNELSMEPEAVAMLDQKLDAVYKPTTVTVAR